MIMMESSTELLGLKMSQPSEPIQCCECLANLDGQWRIPCRLLTCPNWLCADCSAQWGPICTHCPDWPLHLIRPAPVTPPPQQREVALDTPPTSPVPEDIWVDIPLDLGWQEEDPEEEFFFDEPANWDPSDSPEY